MNAERGLLAFVRAELLHELPTTARAPASPAPAPLAPAREPTEEQTNWEDNPASWFAIYDENQNGLLSKDQLLRALVRSNPRLNLEGARSAIAALHLVDDDGGAETISLPRMLEIHETLQATIALQEDSSVDNVLAMLEVMGGPAGITREQAAAALWEENGIIGRAVQRLQRQESGS